MHVCLFQFKIWKNWFTDIVKIKIHSSYKIALYHRLLYASVIDWRCYPRSLEHSGIGAEQRWCRGGRRSSSSSRSGCGTATLGLILHSSQSFGTAFVDPSLLYGWHSIDWCMYEHFMTSIPERLERSMHVFGHWWLVSQEQFLSIRKV